MAERLFAVYPFGVECVCNECNEGRMIPTGMMLPSNPPQYPHKCSKEECGAEQNFTEKYPTIRWVNVPT